jgi:hypothetical protein
VYTEHELGVIRRIKELLYEEGYTIAGAKKRLQSELEDGRSFAAPEVDGELFTPEGEAGGDDVPAIAVGEDETVESAAVEPVEPEPAERAGESGVAPSSEDEKEPSDEESGASTVVAASVAEVAEAPAAVDSALSERVETLEHGLRRVLAEVKSLRELLADPIADR